MDEIGGMVPYYRTKNACVVRTKISRDLKTVLSPAVPKFSSFGRAREEYVVYYRYVVHYYSVMLVLLMITLVPVLSTVEITEQSILYRSTVCT